MGETSFGQYLRQLRKAKGLTLVEVSKLSLISQPFLSQVENDLGGKPSPDALRRLSTALNVQYIGMLIKAGHVTEEEVLTFRREHGINDQKGG